MDRQLGYDAQGITRPHEPLGKQVAGYYNLQGLKTSPATNGPVIVRFNDGTSRIIYHQ
jgi:YD repeat-containing protein